MSGIEVAENKVDVKTLGICLIATGNYARTLTFSLESIEFPTS